MLASSQWFLATKRVDDNDDSAAATGRRDWLAMKSTSNRSHQAK